MKFIKILLLLICISTLSFAKKPKLPLTGKNIAILTADSTHDQEALMPLAYLQAQGANVIIISNYIGKINCYNSPVSFYTEKLISNCKVQDYDALVIPGGHAPARLRTDKQVVKFVKDFAVSGKVLAAVCHGPQLLVSAGLLKGEEATCVNLMKHEYEKAGIIYNNNQVVRSKNIITGKGPKSVSEWCVAIKDDLLQ